MFRAGSRTCALCQAKAFLGLEPPIWLQARSYAYKQQTKRRPARLELSSRVAHGFPKQSARDDASRRKQTSPFAGMNRTRTNVDRRPEPSAMRPETRRAVGRKSQAKPRRDGDFRALKMQRTLSSVSYERRSSIKSRITNVASFDDFRLLPAIHEAVTSRVLASVAECAPTPIQRVAIPALLGNNNLKRQTQGTQQFLLAAETGSGKTLAYLLPIIDAIKRVEAGEVEANRSEHPLEALHKESDTQERRKKSIFELEPPDEDDELRNGQPKAIVLVPTAELVEQVTALAKLICHTVKFRVQGISSAISPIGIRNRLFGTSGIDVLVSTPHLLASIADTERRVLSKVTHLVIDEADSLLDRSFVKETTPIIERSTPSLKQLILCSATIPRSLDSFLRSRFPDIRRLVTPNLHAIPRRVQLGVVDVQKDPYRGNKSIACADTIWSIGRATMDDTADVSERSASNKADVKHIMVFVNERDRAKILTDFLVTKGIDAVTLSRGSDDAPKQIEALADFTNTTVSTSSPTTPLPVLPAAPANVGKRNPSMRKLPNTKVLVATDLGSRGIDTTAVRHVILYDVPHSTIDFIHRLGRTGRMNRRGRGIVLVGKGDRRDVVKEVREGMFMGKALI